MKIKRAVEIVLLLWAGVFLALYAVHLKADFPNYSPWMDWSKYTDEGWYGNAAIEHYLRGHWFVPGDFNPAVALPVWPLMEAAVFHFTGVSVVAVRALTVAVFAGILLAVYFLLRRWSGWSGASDKTTPGAQEAYSLAPAVAVLLLAVSPFFYSFMRLAILEPLLILLMLLALLSAGTEKRWPGRLVKLGILLPLMVLTKTTAIFLMPALFYMVWAASRYRWRDFLRTVAIVGGIGAVLWCGYFFILVRPHYLADYRYLFTANQYEGVTFKNMGKVLHDTFRDGNWISRILWPLTGVAILAAATVLRQLWRNPLFTTLVIWMCGYLFFLGYHNNLQPRYYLVVAVPMIILLTLTVDEAWRAGCWLQGKTKRIVAQSTVAVAGIWMLAAAIHGSALTLYYVRHPQYTFENAAWAVKRTVENGGGRNTLIMSISGNDLSLLTHVLSLCDDFGTMDMEQRLKAYMPGWYATWNEIDDDKVEPLNRLFHLQRVATFKAFDDPERNLLILYRLDPPVQQKPEKKKKRRKTPRLEEEMETPIH